MLEEVETLHFFMCHQGVAFFLPPPPLVVDRANASLTRVGVKNRRNMSSTRGGCQVRVIDINYKGVSATRGEVWFVH